MNEQAAAARAAGSRIVYDTFQVGRTPDMSNFSPSELAAMVNDNSAQFTPDERLWAGAELAGRVAKALSPLDIGNVSDVGSYQRVVKQLYSQMPADVQQALRWTPANAVESDKLIAWSDKHHPRLSDENFWELFTQGQSLPGAYQATHLDLSL
jgi:hypothetical protein